MSSSGSGRLSVSDKGVTVSDALVAYQAYPCLLNATPIADVSA